MAEERSTRGVSLSGELDDKLVAYRDRNDMTTSEAIRSLLRTALEETERDEGQIAESDPDRPDTVRAALLYDAESMKHDALLISGVFTALFALFALPFGLEVLFLLPAVAYALTAFVGYAEAWVLGASTRRDEEASRTKVEA